MISRAVANTGCLIFLAIVMGCNSNSPEQLYKKAEQKELASGIRYDSLFRGLYFGMPYSAFRDHCLQMHVKGVFREGGLKSGAWLECKLNDEMKYPAALNFFPEFQNNRISEMHAAVYYDSEVSWKEHALTRDSLLQDALHLVERWYGAGYFKIDSPDSLRNDIHVKVNGNRRITVYTDETGYVVNLWFVDLLAKKQEDEARVQ